MSNDASAPTVSSLEAELVAAGERLGALMQAVSDEEKAILRSLKAKVEELASEHNKEGRYLDRSAVFAAVIAVDERFSNADLIAAANDYLEKDFLFVKQTH
jgi:hypothetical protein